MGRVGKVAVSSFVEQGGVFRCSFEWGVTKRPRNVRSVGPSSHSFTKAQDVGDQTKSGERKTEREKTETREDEPRRGKSELKL